MEGIVSAYKRKENEAFSQEHKDSSQSVANARVKVERLSLTEKTTLGEQLSTDKTQKLTLQYRCITQFKHGKAIAKMLSDYKMYFSPDRSTIELKACSMRLDEELSELIALDESGKELMASSTTLMIPKKRQRFYRAFGFMLDVAECNVRAVYEKDACVYRVNDVDGKYTSWCMESKTYVNCENKPTKFSGKFHSTCKEISNNPEDLLTRSQMDPVFPGYLKMNEVIVDYKKSSVIGLIATKNPTTSSHITEAKYKMLSVEMFKADCLTFKAKVKNGIGIDLPLFLYDHIEGDISLLQD